MKDTQAVDVVTFYLKGTRVCCVVSNSADYKMKMIFLGAFRFLIITVYFVEFHRFGTGRYKRQADTTLLFEYISTPSNLIPLTQMMQLPQMARV